MGIISISMNEETLEKLDEIQDALEISGRSEAVRAAIGMASNQISDMKVMSGPVEGVLIIVKSDHTDSWMSLIQAKYQDDIKTQLHSHLKNHKCLEVMVISSEGNRMASMLQEIYLSGKADYVRFVKN